MLPCEVHPRHLKLIGWPEFAGLQKSAFQRQKDGISMKYDATFEGFRDGQRAVKCMSERRWRIYMLKRVDSCAVSCVRDERRVIRYQNLVPNRSSSRSSWCRVNNASLFAFYQTDELWFGKSRKLDESYMVNPFIICIISNSEFQFNRK